MINPISRRNFLKLFAFAGAALAPKAKLPTPLPLDPKRANFIIDRPALYSVQVFMERPEAWLKTSINGRMMVKGKYKTNGAAFNMQLKAGDRVDFESDVRIVNAHLNPVTWRKAE